MIVRGWWNMPCWNGLSDKQQHRLVEHGNLEFGYEPDGWCNNGAQVAVETMSDAAPGPRFYCVPCAIEYLQSTSVLYDEHGAPVEAREVPLLKARPLDAGPVNKDR